MRVFILLVFALIPSYVGAQELHQDLQGVWRAEVLEVRDEGVRTIPGTGVETPVQTLTARFLEGERKGETITFENDYIQLEEGDTFYANYLITIDGLELYSVREVDRRGGLMLIAFLFIATVLFFGGMQGLRSLISLAGSLLAIVFILVPALVAGHPPIPISIAVASVVLFSAIFLTHGFNRRSTIAFLGTTFAVVLTGLLAYFSVSVTALTGFSTDESVYLNLNTNGELDFVGLLLAGIIIGALGVLDDIAVTQVAVVRELLHAGPTLTRWDVYRRALRVGREHTSALINTLVLAYTGVALPLLLLFSFSESGILSILNSELFATEIVRTLVGSIGLVATIPITTLLAVWLLYGREDTDIEKEGHHAHT